MSESCPACQSCWRHVGAAAEPVLQPSSPAGVSVGRHTEIFDGGIVPPGLTCVIQNFLSVYPGFEADEVEWMSGDHDCFRIESITIRGLNQLTTPVPAFLFQVPFAGLHFSPCTTSMSMSVEVTNISLKHAVARIALRGPVLPSSSPTPMGWRTYPVKP